MTDLAGERMKECESYCRYDCAGWAVRDFGCSRLALARRHASAKRKQPNQNSGATHPPHRFVLITETSSNVRKGDPHATYFGCVGRAAGRWNERTRHRDVDSG